MPDGPNFLLGKGERLTEPVVMAGRRVDRAPPYTFGQARTRVLPMVRTAARTLDALPELACPHDEAIGALTLNPEYIAKSSFPSDLLRAVGLRLVGSRGRRIRPERRSRGREPKETLTTELFVAARRRVYREWSASIPGWSSETRGADELAAVEVFRAPTAEEKILPIHTDADEVPLEIVLHASEFKRDAYILEAFEAFVKDEGLTIDFDRRIHTGGLCFLGVKVPKNKIEALAEFSFLRVAREMPRLRAMRPILRSLPSIAGKSDLPSQAALDPNIRMAVFDGGMPQKSPLAPWTRSEDAPGTGKPVAEFVDHGHSVTSALLFGSPEPGTRLARPFANVNHYRGHQHGFRK